LQPAVRLSTYTTPSLVSKRRETVWDVLAAGTQWLPLGETKIEVLCRVPMLSSLRSTRRSTASAPNGRLEISDAH
jgi:hypothetical protein